MSEKRAERKEKGDNGRGKENILSAARKREKEKKKEKRERGDNGRGKKSADGKEKEIVLVLTERERERKCEGGWGGVRM